MQVPVSKRFLDNAKNKFPSLELPICTNVEYNVYTAVVLGWNRKLCEDISNSLKTLFLEI
jgi:hypothetical protein